MVFSLQQRGKVLLKEGSRIHDGWMEEKREVVCNVRALNHPIPQLLEAWKTSDGSMLSWATDEGHEGGSAATKIDEYIAPLLTFIQDPCWSELWRGMTI
jgi:hypothetical protein